MDRTAPPERRTKPQSAPSPGPRIERGSPRTALGRQIGNQAFARLVSGVAVQRHEGPTTNAEAEQRTGGPTGAGSEGPATVAPGETEASQPAGGTGTTGTGTATLTGAARRQAIEDTLRASATGMWALEVVRRWSLPVNYEFTGTGSYHQGGSIYINRSLGIGAAAMTMMHECQHAETFKSGRQADRTTLTRAEYITRSIADEAEAVVRQIEGLAVTQRLGVDMTGNSVGDGLKQRYLNVFYAKGRELRAANPDITTAQVNARCRTFARDTEVTNWFHDGTFVTSTNNNSYAVFYGLQWDAVHPTPAP